MIFEQGDIIEVDFDPTLGHEPKKRRPALVVSSSEFNSATSMTIVCPITSRMSGFFLHEPLPKGIKVQGEVVMEQARALDVHARNPRKIGALDQADMEPILVCLRSFY